MKYLKECLKTLKITSLIKVCMLVLVSISSSRAGREFTAQDSFYQRLFPQIGKGTQLWAVSGFQSFEWVFGSIYYLFLYFFLCPLIPECMRIFVSFSLRAIAGSYRKGTQLRALMNSLTPLLHVRSPYSLERARFKGAKDSKQLRRQEKGVNELVEYFTTSTLPFHKSGFFSSSRADNVEGAHHISVLDQFHGL